MIQIKNHKQIYLFDPWEYISPKHRKMLDESWSGLFQKEVLPSLPIDKVVTYFHNSFGRPTKELHTVLGVMEPAHKSNAHAFLSLQLNQ